MRRLNPSYFVPALVCLNLLITAIACSQTSGDVVFVTATPVNAAIVPGSLPTLPNPFIPTKTPAGATATPLQPTANPTFPPDPAPSISQYTIQAGDTLSALAALYGTDITDITRLNSGLNAETMLVPGQVVMLPGTPTRTTTNFKIIPDSEMVNSPAASKFDVEAYIKFQPGFIRVYSEDVLGRRMSGADIIRFISTATSVNPRLLLALLEYRGGWVTNPVPGPLQMQFPLGLVDLNNTGLFGQLSWAANTLNYGYYSYKQRGVRFLGFSDRSRLAYAPGLNPGTTGVQYFLAWSTANREQWLNDIAPEGFFTTYMAMFGDPFAYAIEPLSPPNLQQPEMTLPFERGETWYMTSGPHGGWDARGSGWAAVDFAPPKPPDELLAQQGYCYVSPAYATAAIAGLVVRAGDGVVVIDADMDGDERTGWTLAYLHVNDDADRVQAGTVVQPGSRIGHPSCAGFYLNSQATHLHLARRYNGEWLAADCPACAPGSPEPKFVLGGWTVRGYPDQVYQGYMENGTRVVRAEQGRDNPANNISW